MSEDLGDSPRGVEDSPDTRSLDWGKRLLPEKNRSKISNDPRKREELRSNEKKKSSSQMEYRTDRTVIMKRVQVGKIDHETLSLRVPFHKEEATEKPRKGSTTTSTVLLDGTSRTLASARYSKTLGETKETSPVEP